MLIRLLAYLLYRLATATAPVSSGVAALAQTLQQQRTATNALNAGSLQYLLNSSGNAVVIWGQDISEAPIGQYSKTPSTQSTGLTGPGIATKKSGSWVQVA